MLKQYGKMGMLASKNETLHTVNVRFGSRLLVVLSVGARLPDTIVEDGRNVVVPRRLRSRSIRILFVHRDDGAGRSDDGNVVDRSFDTDSRIRVLERSRERQTRSARRIICERFPLAVKVGSMKTPASRLVAV